MRLSWADQAPAGISFEPEQQVLTGIENLAASAGYELVEVEKLDTDVRSIADMVVRTNRGLLLFGVRRKGQNDRGKIDIETRPDSTYRTRHLLLKQNGAGQWELRNDSDLSEGGIPGNPSVFHDLVERLFAAG